MSNPGETAAAPAATETTSVLPAETVTNTTEAAPVPETQHPALEAIAAGRAVRATPTFDDLEAVVKALIAH